MNFIFSLVTIVVVISSVTSSHHYHRYHIHPLSEEFIDYINSVQKTWKAGRNFHRNISLSYIESLAGTIVEDPNTYEIFLDKPPQYADVSLPVNFDTRYKWPYCETMDEIRDQGGCKSCWAVAVASAMTDRLCIITSGTETDYFSDQDIISCCQSCSSKFSPCYGGSVIKAWEFSKHEGVVSGGKYHSKGGCKAYVIPPCNHTSAIVETQGKQKTCVLRTDPQRCETRCTTNESINYKADKKRLSNVYSLHYDRYDNAPEPMSEILKYGPITATFTLYDDFMHYKEGVYRRINSIHNRVRGNHTVKIMGWGVDENTGTKYWLAANSWNSDWGDNGFFKIVRGENHCNIESFMLAGIM